MPGTSGYRFLLSVTVRWGLVTAALLLGSMPNMVLGQDDGGIVKFSPGFPIPDTQQLEDSLAPAREPVTATIESASDPDTGPDAYDWIDNVRVGYDGGFVIASKEPVDLNASEASFLFQTNGWGQLRHSLFNPEDSDRDLNQFQLKRGRIIFSGHAFTSDFTYLVQLDGRSSSGDDMRLLDYFMTYDIGHHSLGRDQESLVFKTGKYKMPFSMARYLSGRQLEFTDRSVSSTFFDVNRSLAWGLYGKSRLGGAPLDWELAVFNGLVTGGAETGSSGSLDNNFAYSFRFFIYPTGQWGRGELADFERHRQLATRSGIGFATSTISEDGQTEFESIRVVDSGRRLSDILPPTVTEYSVYLFSVDTSFQWCGWSGTVEYYFRNITNFTGAPFLPDLYDHGFWLQLGKFAFTERTQLVGRWSLVAGNSGTLGVNRETANEVGGAFVWYMREQHAKFTFDVINVDGAPINSSALDLNPGDRGWLVRSQIQFSF